MNKITPHLVRDLDKTLPEGTECYLCAAARRALTKYRKSHRPMALLKPAVFMKKDEALSALSQKLGRGLSRFFTKDIQAALDAMPENKPSKWFKLSY